MFNIAKMVSYSFMKKNIVQIRDTYKIYSLLAKMFSIVLTV